MIKVIENFLTEKECNHIISSNEPQLTHTSVITETNPTAYNSFKRECLTTYINVDNLKEKVTTVIDEDYKDLNVISSTKLLPFEFIKYEKGNHFDWHSDVIDTNRNKEELTCVAFLNTNYDGGNLLIKEDNVTHTVTKETGTLCIFPSKYRHKVTKVITGDRYTLCCWYYKGLQQQNLVI